MGCTGSCLHNSYQPLVDEEAAYNSLLADVSQSRLTGDYAIINVRNNLHPGTYVICPP